MRRIFAIVLPCAGISLLGCGGDTPGDTPYAPKSVKAVWENHFSAFAAGDVDKIMKDYDDSSKVVVFNDACPGDGKNLGSPMQGYKEYASKEAIQQFFEQLFKTLGETPGDAVTNIGPLDMLSEGKPSVDEGVGPNGNVFLIWKAASKGIDEATESFLFTQNEAGTYLIKTQSVVVFQSSETCPDGPNSNEGEGNGKVALAFRKYFPAWENREMDPLMELYSDNSVIQMYDSDGSTYYKFEGTDQIRAFYEYMLTNATATPIERKVVTLEDNLGFAVWTEPEADIFATVTFDQDGYIIHENAVFDQHGYIIHENAVWDEATKEKSIAAKVVQLI